MDIKIGNRVIKLNEHKRPADRAVTALYINRDEITESEIQRVASIYGIPVADIKSRL